MKKLFTFSLALVFIVLQQTGRSQHVDFERENFPDKQDEFYIVQRAYKKAEINFSNQNWETAAKKYQEAYCFNPRSGKLNFNYAFCLHQLHQDSSASVLFRSAKNLLPDVHPKIDYYIARSSHLACEFDTARNYYQKALTQAQKSADEQSEYIADLKKYIAECKVGKEFKAVENRHLKIERLFDEKNTDDYAPFVSQNDSVFYFTSKRASNYGSAETEDIYFSLKNDTLWSNPKNIGKPVNSASHDALVGISPDGKQIYVYADINQGDIFYTDKTPDGRLILSPLDYPLNSNNREEAVFLNFRKDTAYIVSERESGKGGSDIFISVKTDSIWSVPKSLSGKVNTEYNETAPFIAGNTLYFASQGHKSMGGYDIFRSRKNTDGSWEAAQNLGFPVNSPYDDMFFTKNSNGKYFSSNRSGNKGNSMILLIKQIKSAKDTNTIASHDSLEAKNLKANSSFIKVGSVISVSEVLFDYNDYKNPKPSGELDKLAEYLTDNPNAELAIIGFTDEIGSKEGNKRLAKRRADYVKKYLVEKGVNSANLIVKFQGEAEPTARSRDENNQIVFKALPYNRRVEFRVLEQGDTAILQIQPIAVPEKYRIERRRSISPIYSICLFSSKKQIPLSDFNPLQAEEFFSEEEKVYNYYLGKFSNLKDAKTKLEGIKKSHPDAFVFLRNF